MTRIPALERAKGVMMNFLVPDWCERNISEIYDFFRKKDHTLFIYEEKPRNYHYDPMFRKKFLGEVEGKKIDAVFSQHFFPILSDLCEQCSMPYISWCSNDRINRLLFTDSVFHSCNYIFHSDSEIVRRLLRAGAENVYYLPWAAASAGRPEKTDEAVDISAFTVIDEQEELNYLLLLKNLPIRTKGFIDGLLDAQEKIYGFNFIENVLNHSVMTEIEKALPIAGVRGGFASLEERYAYEVLYPGLTRREWNHTASVLRDGFSDKNILYEKSEAPAKINLFIAPRGIQNGIPAEAMRILGQGGFLLTNFQNDYLDFFESGKEYVYYESEEDLREKLKFYISNDEERKKIQKRAFEVTQKNHTFAQRLEEMFGILNIDR